MPIPTDAGARQRTAINLAGVKNDEVSRGVELATVGLLQPTRRLLVDLKLLSSSPLRLKDRMELEPAHRHPRGPGTGDA